MRQSADWVIILNTEFVGTTTCWLSDWFVWPFTALNGISFVHTDTRNEQTDTCATHLSLRMAFCLWIDGDGIEKLLYDSDFCLFKDIKDKTVTWFVVVIVSVFLSSSTMFIVSFVCVKLWIICGRPTPSYLFRNSNLDNNSDCDPNVAICITSIVVQLVPIMTLTHKSVSAQLTSIDQFPIPIKLRAKHTYHKRVGLGRAIGSENEEFSNEM